MESEEFTNNEKDNTQTHTVVCREEVRRGISYGVIWRKWILHQSIYR